MNPKEFKNGAKYFSNVENVLKSIKNIKPIKNNGVSADASENIGSNNEKLLMSMIKGLVSIVDTQNDILKYIVSHDSKAIIEESADNIIPGRFFFYEPLKTAVVIKELINAETVNAHLICQGKDKVINIKDLK